MFNSTVLEVAIGLAFVYLLLSLICSSLNEVVAGVLATRSKTLKQGIRILLAGDNGFLKKIYENPLIKSLHRKTWFDTVFFNRDRGPSYIPARTFALALFDTVAHEENGVQVAASDSKDLQKYAEKSFAAMESSVNAISIDSIKRPLQAILNSAKEQANTWEDAIDEARKSTEQWFDNTMGRVTGWYTRKTQLIMVILAVIIVGAANIDTIMIGRSLVENNIIRASITAAAAEYIKNQAADTTVSTATADTVKTSEPDSTALTSVTDSTIASKPDTAAAGFKKVEELREKLGSFNLPLGWSKKNVDEMKNNDEEMSFNDFLLKIIGLLITAVAVSFGAPFWFDLLKKLINVRFAGKTDTKPAVKEGSK